MREGRVEMRGIEEIVNNYERCDFDLNCIFSIFEKKEKKEKRTTLTRGVGCVFVLQEGRRKGTHHQSLILIIQSALIMTLLSLHHSPHSIVFIIFLNEMDD